MAVETVYGTYVTKKLLNPTNGLTQFPDVMNNGGRVRNVSDTVELPASADIGSKVYLAYLPSDCVILPQSEINFDDLGTGVTLNIGDKNDDDALATAIDVSTAAGKSTVLEAVDIANYGKKLWQLLGYIKDPKVMIELYASTAGAASGGGTLSWNILYVHD